jgi:hypothetical protein
MSMLHHLSLHEAIDMVYFQSQAAELLLEHNQTRLRLRAHHLERDEVLLRVLLALNHTLLKIATAAFNLLSEAHLHALNSCPMCYISSNIMRRVGLTGSSDHWRRE